MTTDAPTPPLDIEEIVAILYCRVSSVVQVQEGHGLESQETRCREYADRKGYRVIETFFERAITGGVADRPSFNAMLDFIRAQDRKVVVIIDDISRFARDIESHWALRRALKEIGGELESPSVTFGEDSDAILVENLLASVSQHQRQKNGEQTKNRMRARLLNGYWCFAAPPGSRFQKVRGHGNLLVRDEPLASIYQEALEGFASGRFDTQAEVKRFLESQPIFTNGKKGGVVRFEDVIRLLTRPHYAGLIERTDWDVSLRKGHHEPIISVETYDRIQERLKEGARVPARRDINADFPLRGFVTCADCDKPLTACWSKSKTGKKHPYYMCFTKGCESYRKSIRRETLEGDFEALLKTLRPSQKLFHYFSVIFKREWELRMDTLRDLKRQLRSDILKLEGQIEKLVDCIVEAESPSTVTAYERRIAKLEREKLIKEDKIASGTQPQRSFREMFELAFGFLASPWKIWESDSLEAKRTVLKLAI